MSDEELLEWAEKLGIRSWDCCEVIGAREVGGDLPSGGKWDGLDPDEALSRAERLDALFGRDFVEGVARLVDDGNVERAKLASFARKVWDATKGVVPFTEDDMPSLWYCEDGDILHVHLSVGSGFHERVNSSLSVERDFDTEEILGFELWGFSKMTPRLVEWTRMYFANIEAGVDDAVWDAISEKKAAVGA